jgi:hypothetical protein
VDFFYLLHCPRIGRHEKRIFDRKICAIDVTGNDASHRHSSDGQRDYHFDQSHATLSARATADCILILKYCFQELKTGITAAPSRYYYILKGMLANHFSGKYLYLVLSRFGGREGMLEAIDCPPTIHFTFDQTVSGARQ